MLKRLEGLKQGDKFDFVLSCEEAFGERNEEHVMELDKEIFMVDGKFDDQTVFEGNTVPMMTSEGLPYKRLRTKSYRRQSFDGFQSPVSR